MSVATWSLRERAVCSRPPTGPTISVSRRSTAMWMSSSSSRNRNSPASSSSATRSSPPSSASRSVVEMIWHSASIFAWARDCSMSYGARRQSKPIDALSCWKTGSCGCEKRDMPAMMSQMEVLVRPATASDRADALLYESARPYYDAFAGEEARARQLLAMVWEQRGHAASWEICAVAEVEGHVVGVLAGYPVVDGDRYARRFLSLPLKRMPVWRWPAVVAHLRAAHRLSPRPPRRAWYVDALAVAPGWRRHGVARRLLDEAARRAAEAG